MEKIVEYLTTFKQIIALLDVPAVMFALGMIAYLMVLMRWHNAQGDFDFRKALLDPPAAGAVSLSRLGQLTALVVSTSLLIYFAMKDKLPEWMFAAYMTVWAGTYIANKFAPGKEQPKQG